MFSLISRDPTVAAPFPFPFSPRNIFFGFWFLEAAGLLVAGSRKQDDEAAMYSHSIHSP